MAFKNYSSTITTGGTAQVLVPANGIRRQLVFQNISDIDLWLCFTGIASAGSGSIKISAGAIYQTPDFLFKDAPESPAISIFGATAGKAFTAFGA